MTLDTPILLVGRSQECGLLLHDATVSRKHATVLLRDGCYYLNRIGNSRLVVNGVLVDGERELNHLDQIQLSPTTLLAFVDEVRG